MDYEKQHPLADHPLAALPREDLDLIVELVLRSGSLKDLATAYGVTYPTIRLRLDRVIEHLQAAVKGKEPDPLRELLARLVERGEMSPSGARSVRDLVRGLAQHARFKLLPERRWLMIPWWTSQQAGLFGGIAGTLVGILGGLLGTVCGICAPRGKCKTFVYALAAIIIAAGLISLVAGIAALLTHQPYEVYYPLLLGGFICTLVSGALLPAIRRQYQAADHRHLEAEELRRG